MRAEISSVSHTQTTAPNGYGANPVLSLGENTVNITAGLSPSDVPTAGRPLDMEDLYPVAVGRGQLLSTARTLLSAGQERLNRAQEYLRDGNQVGADYEISMVQGDIPELFCCSSISEGLAVIALAVHHALRNRGPSPLTEKQLNILSLCIGRLNNEIFLSYEAALNLIDELEESDLNVNPPEAETLSSILIDESAD